ncbi:MAG: MFS transporter, partial [Deltaproteobacteria bacterium]|nr:MFS transporter [Deltaproteobacteria bacterium]
FVLGLIVFIFSAIPSLIFLKRRPEDVGLLPDGRELAEKVSLLGDETPLKTISRSQASPDEEAVWNRQDIFRTKVFWQLTFIMSIIYFTGAGINFHLFPFLTDKEVPPGTAVLAITVLSIASAIGGVFFGFLAERVSVRKLMSLILITSGTMFFFVFWVFENMVLLFLFASLFGIIRGGVLPTIFMVWADFYGRRSSGTVLGLASPFRLTANAAGPVFGAICFDLQDNYWIPFTIYSILLVLAGLASLIAKPPVISPSSTSQKMPS